MIQRLGFFSKAITEATTFDNSFAVISINNPASETNIKGTDNVLRLEFLDIETPEADQEMINEGIAFNTNHAKQITEFLNKISENNDINTLVIHCFAGVSRSAAVSLCSYHYLQENNLLSINFDFPDHMQTHYANKLVISTFQPLLKENIYIPTQEEAKNALESVLVYVPKMFKSLKLK